MKIWLAGMMITVRKILSQSILILAGRSVCCLKVCNCCDFCVSSFHEQLFTPLMESFGAIYFICNIKCNIKCIIRALTCC